MKLRILNLQGKTVELDVTDKMTLDDVLNQIATLTSVQRNQSVFVINKKRTFINDDPTQNYLEYLKGLGVDVSQDTVTIYQILTLGQGPYFRRGPNTVSTAVAHQIEKSNDGHDLICAITLEAIVGPAVKIHTRFYSVNELTRYLKQEHDKYFSAIDRGQEYKLTTPFREALPKDLLTTMHDRNFSKVICLLASMSNQSQEEYDTKYASLADTVVENPVDNDNTGGNTYHFN